MKLFHGYKKHIYKFILLSGKDLSDKQFIWRVIFQYIYKNNIVLV